MALEKMTETIQGFEASYWKLDMITIDRNHKEASFTLNLYLDKKKGAIGDAFIESVTITLFHNIEEEDEVSNNLVTERYEKYFGENTKYTDIYNACYECAKEIYPYFMDAKTI